MLEKSKVKFHMTPDGPKPCAATERTCRYANVEHFYESVASPDRTKAQLIESRVIMGVKKNKDTWRDDVNPHLQSREYFKFDEKLKERITNSSDWGAELTDIIEEQIANTGPIRQINFTIDRVEELIEGDPETQQGILIQASPRLESTLNAYSNIYRVYTWDPSKANEQRIADRLIAESDEDKRRFIWANIPKENKWEVAFGGFHDESVKNIVYRDNIENHQEVLNRLNDWDIDKLESVLYSKNAATKAQWADNTDWADNNLDESEKFSARLIAKRGKNVENIVSLIKSAEQELLSPYDAYDRGLGFYTIDSNNRTIVDENLSTTVLSGRTLERLGRDARLWMRGTWKGDSSLNSPYRLSESARKKRAEEDLKGMPYRSPMTFWTSNTPDGSRWEVALMSHSKEESAHRVRYIDSSTPELAAIVTAPKTASEGAVEMEKAMEKQYGKSDTWPSELKRDMKRMHRIAEGYDRMRVNAKEADDWREYYLNEEAAEKLRNKGDSHKEIFGPEFNLFS